MGLKSLLNDAIGADWLKDKEVTCSNWDAPSLSLPQLKYAVLDAWASEILGRVSVAKCRHSLSTTSLPLFSSMELPRALLAQPLVRTFNEAQAYRDAGKDEFEVKVENVIADVKNGTLSRIAMGSYKDKVRQLCLVQARCASLTSKEVETGI